MSICHNPADSTSNYIEVTLRYQTSYRQLQAYKLCGLGCKLGLQGRAGWVANQWPTVSWRAPPRSPPGSKHRSRDLAVPARFRVLIHQKFLAESLVKVVTEIVVHKVAQLYEKV